MDGEDLGRVNDDEQHQDEAQDDGVRDRLSMPFERTEMRCDWLRLNGPLIKRSSWLSPPSQTGMRCIEIVFHQDKKENPIVVYCTRNQ